MILISILCLFCVCFSLNFYCKNSIQKTITSPSTITTFFLFIYAVVGVNLFWKGNYFFVDIDYQPTLFLTYISLALFIVVFFLTEISSHSLIKIKNLNNFFLQSSPVTSVKFFGFINIYTLTVLISAFIFLPVINTNGIFLFIVSSLGPIIGYQLIKKDKKFYIYIVFFLILCVELKFRYRIFISLSPVILYFLMKYKIFSLKFLFILILSFTLLVMLIVITGRNKNIPNFDNLLNKYSIINGLFNDTSTVLVTGKFISRFEHDLEYQGIKQILYIVNYFVPNILTDQKMYSPILDNIKTLIASETAGAATMSIGEYYHTAGFFGIIMFAFIISLFLTYYHKRQIIIPSIYNKYFYYCLIFVYLNSLTRGYLPQNFFDLTSVLFGFFLIKRVEAKY